MKGFTIQAYQKFEKIIQFIKFHIKGLVVYCYCLGNLKIINSGKNKQYEIINECYKAGGGGWKGVSHITSHVMLTLFYAMKHLFI